MIHHTAYTGAHLPGQAPFRRTEFHHKFSRDKRTSPARRCITADLTWKSLEKHRISQADLNRDYDFKDMKQYFLK